MKAVSLILLLILPCLRGQAQHPVAYGTRQDFTRLRTSIHQYPLLNKSFREIKNSVDRYLGKDIDVPVPKDPAGGYTHDRHKANYTLMFSAGILYQLTGEKKYAEMVKALLLKYAALNPSLKNHPESKGDAPGRIFWQALNDANWLVYSGLAFDCIQDCLTAAERKNICDGAFKPEVDFFTIDLKSWFNLIHNQAVWACAGVGIVGIATDNTEYLEMALKGTTKDGRAGLLGQLNGLFSPDGYYIEGPYYARYALLPFYLFANALNNRNDSYGIFQYRNSILKKGLLSTLQQTNIDGAFYAYNDALKEKNYTTNEIVEALDIYRKVYGPDDGLLAVAAKQQKVNLNLGGMLVAKDLASTKTLPRNYPYHSAEYADGAEGDKGGISALRAGRTDSMSSLIYKYSSQGMGHGHFDKLSINLYDNGHEILQDYGAVRYINIEQKWGGRYLPETKAFAAQTIAHNTVVVDERSDFNADEKEGDRNHPARLFSQLGNSPLQVVSAVDEHAYKGVRLHRTVYMVQLPGFSKPLIIDIFRTQSSGMHQYDLPFYYLGTLISTNARYAAFEDRQVPLGKANGYQFLWKEAEALHPPALCELTFLNSNTYYSVSSLAGDSTQLYYARIGAHDPGFNLRHDPVYIIRKKGGDQVFVNVIEEHGNFDPGTEISTGSYSLVRAIEVLRNDEEYTLARVLLEGRDLVVAQCNNDASLMTAHSAMIDGKAIGWTGPFTVRYEGKEVSKKL